MVELPENNRSMWLFPDSIAKNNTYKFLGFNLTYESRKGNKIPVMVLHGALKTINQETKEESEVVPDEIILAIWNIKNYKELKKEFGKDTDEWNNKNIEFTAIADGNHVTLTPVETIS